MMNMRSESDLTAFSERKSNFKCRHEITTNLLCPATRPPAVQVLYEAATTPITPALRHVNPGAVEEFACTPILGAKRKKRNVDEIETRKPASLSRLRQWTSSEALGDVTVDPDCTARICAIPLFTSDETEDITDAAAGSTDHKLPSPEEQVQAVANKFPSEVIPVDISGRSFERMSILRRSCIDCNGGVRRRTGKRKVRGKRRNTIAGTDHKELEAIVGNSESKELSEDITSSGISVNTEKKSHIEYLKEWGRSRLRLIRNLDPGVKMRERNETLARKKWDKDEPQHSSSGNWSASSESGSTVTSHQPRSSISSGSVCNKHGTLLPGGIRRPTASGSSSVTSGDSTLHDEGETCSTYSCDTEGYYTSFHMDSGLKTLREEEPMAALTTTSALSESHLNDTSLCSNGGADSEYELFGKGSTSTTASSAGTVCTTLLSPPAPPLPQRTSSSLSGSSSLGSRTLPERRDASLEASDVPSKTQSLKYDKKLSAYVDNTLLGAAAARLKQYGGNKHQHQLKLTKENINKLKQLAEEDNKYTSSGATGTNTNHVITVDVHHSGSNGRRSAGNSPDKCEGSPDSGHNTCSSPVDSVTETPSICDFELSECSDLEGLDRVERIRSKTTINSSRIPSMCVITPPQSDDETSLKLCGTLDDSGDYVTIRDTSIISDIETEPAPLFPTTPPQQEYVSLNDLALNDNSLERKKRGARVTLNSEGKVVYSSDSLRRRKKIHTTNTFEPGPCVAKTTSPVPQHKNFNIRPVGSATNILSSVSKASTENIPPIISNPNDVRNSPLPSRIRERMTPLGTLTRDPTPPPAQTEPPRPLEPIVLNRSPNPRRSPLGAHISPGKQLYSNTNPSLVGASRPLSPLVSAERKPDSKPPSVLYPNRTRAQSPHTIVKASNSPLPNRTIKGAYVKMNEKFLETSIDEDPADKKQVKRSDSYRLANQENIPTGGVNVGSGETSGVTAGDNLLDAIRHAARSNTKDICDDTGSSRLGTWPRPSAAHSPVQSSTPTKHQRDGMDISVNISPITHSAHPPESLSPPPEVEYPPRMNNIAASYKNVPYTENVRNMLSNIRSNELSKTYTPVTTNSQSNLDQHLIYLQSKYPALRKDSETVPNKPIASNNQSSTVMPPLASNNQVSVSNNQTPVVMPASSPVKVPYNPYASIRRVAPQRSVSSDQRATSPTASERLFPSGAMSPTRRIEATLKRDAQRPLSPSATDRLFPSGSRPLSPTQRPTSPSSATERLFPNGSSRPTSPIETASDRIYGRTMSPTRKISNGNSVQRPQSPLYKGPPPYMSPTRKPLVSSSSSDNFRKTAMSPVTNLRKTSSPQMSHSQSEGYIESHNKSFDSSPDVTNHPEQTKSSEPDLINNTQHGLSRFIRNSVQSKSVNYGRNKIQEISRLPDKIKQTSRLEFKNLLTKVGWSSASTSNKVSAAERLQAKNISAADRLKERTPTPRKKLVSRSNSSLSSSIHNSSELDEAVSSDSSASVATVRTRLDFNNIEVKPTLAKVNNNSASRSSSIDSSSDVSIPKSSALVSEQMKAFASNSPQHAPVDSPKLIKSPTLETAL
ncbi:hypothetical protein WDU94_011559 [Cyamophila willieti]